MLCCSVFNIFLIKSLEVAFCFYKPKVLFKGFEDGLSSDQRLRMESYVGGFYLRLIEWNNILLSCGVPDL